jgi:signal transduction histidine kinase
VGGVRYNPFIRAKSVVNMNSLRLRLFAAFFSIILIVLALVSLGLLIFLRNSALIERPAVIQLNQAERALLRQLPIPDNLRNFDLDAYVKEAAEIAGVRVLLLDVEGNVRADSNPELAVPAFRLNALRTDTSGARVGQARDADDGTWVFTARRFPRGYLILASLQPRFPALTFFVEDLLGPLLQAAGVAALVALVLSGLLARSVAQPLQKMAQVAQGIAHGDYAQTAPLAGPQEVRALGHAINEMSQQVQTSQQAQRDFLANISHDLKTPLTSIQGFAQAIADGTANSPEAIKRAAGIIFDEADRMRRLVADLLELARLDAGLSALNRAPLEPRLLLVSVAEKFLLRAKEKGVFLSAELPQSLPTLKGDADRLAQVFTNLLDNALKHTPANGHVLLSASLAEGQLEVNVSDTGPGIPPEDLGRIFERFYQVDKSRARPSGAGVGLGLAITKEIVEAHHGAIAVRSAVGEGTRFTVRLPLSLPDESTVVKKRKSQ